MIEVSHLSKYYGDFLAVDDLSFQIEGSGVYGFLGPNGAGKSTTMNIMTGCLSPTDGTVRIGGFDMLEQPEKAKRLIGYLPEQPPLYPGETPQEYLTFVGEAKGLHGKALRAQIDSAVERTGLSDVRERLIGTLSKGYRQRVGIAQALLGEPEVIILDEPTVGLDPLQIIEIRDFIRELGQTHTVILSSHILSEVQAVCAKVLIISRGRLAAFDTPENLEKLLHSASGIRFQVQARREEAEALLSGVEGVCGWEVEETDGVCAITAKLTQPEEARAVCGKLTIAFAQQGLAVFEMQTQRANLEDVFLELTESGSAEEAATEAPQAEQKEPEADTDAQPATAEESEGEEV